MATKNKDVIGIAKGTTRKKTGRKPAAKKTGRKPAAKKKAATKEVVVPVLTAEQERDLKAKARVEELLGDVQLTSNKKDELLELDETPETSEPKGVEWLEEQITLIAQDNERLKAENDILLNENQQFRAGGNPVDDGVKNNVVSLFDELQQNHIKMGIPAGSKVGNFRIYCPGFLDRMIVFFPFLNDYKKY